MKFLCRHRISAVAASTQAPPTGDGLCGERVARTPKRCPSSRGTCTLAFTPPVAWSGDQRRCRSVLQWKMYRTHTCEYCSSPSKHPMGMSGLHQICASSNESPLACCMVWDSQMPKVYIASLQTLKVCIAAEDMQDPHRQDLLQPV